MDLTLIPKDVTTIGINRICARYTPDYLVLIDRTIEDKYVPTDGSLRGGVITIASSCWSSRKDAIVCKRGPNRYVQQPPWVWPEAMDEPLIMTGNSATYAFQWAYLNGAGEIAVIGLDYSQRLLREAGKQTHFYGNNPMLSMTKNMGDMTGVQKQFWLEAKERVKSINLTPYENSIFQTHAQWSREAWEAYCSR